MNPQIKAWYIALCKCGREVDCKEAYNVCVCSQVYDGKGEEVDA